MDSIAHYKVLDPLGDGRLGKVFRARDTKLGRTVAVKIPPASIQNDQSKRNEFLADARTAMTLSHPNIAAIYEAGDDSGRVYLACEFVPGDTLDRVVAGHPLNPRRAIDLAAQIADALADAHATELSHGDLTADSIVVTPKGNAKILDFGLARWTRTQTGDSDESGDIRALGALFFEMLTGRPPAAATPPTSINKSLPKEVDEVVIRALDTTGERSYQSAATFAAELRAVGAVLESRADNEISARPMSVRVARRRSTLSWIAALAAAALALAAVWWWWWR